MSNDTQQIVNKAWNFAHVLRDDGLSYMAYTEQITFLLFLKMADEQATPPVNRKSGIPAEFNWQSLTSRDGDDLLNHYRHILEELGKKPGMLGEIFKRAKPEIQNPAILRRLIVDLIDAEEWSKM
jgi:type I restriction enzyme M protein